jgi:hypothetical protein
MAVSTVHVLHGIVNSSTFLSQIVNARPITDAQTMIAQSAGLPFPLFTGTIGVNPAVPFETTQLKTILDLSGALSSIVDLSGANTDLHFKKVTDLGRRLADATTGHLRFRMAQAFLSLERISAGHNSEAVASCLLGTTYDGTNSPLVPAGSLALAGTPVGATHWLAGPVKLNGSTLPGVENIDISFNRQVMQMGADGELYPTFAACQFYSPVITIRCYEHVWATYGIDGTALSGSAGAFTAYLRKVSNVGRVAAATTEHIAFTGTTGVVHVEEATGGNNDASMVTVRVTLVGADASTEPIAVSTGSAIS